MRAATAIIGTVAVVGLGWLVWRKVLGGDRVSAQSRLDAWVKGTEAGSAAVLENYVAPVDPRG
jgi:hypothetical protein